MPSFEIVLILLVVLGALAPVATKIGVPMPIVLVFGGIGLSWVPQIAAFQFDPEAAFLIFVPPMLYVAALTTSLRELKRSIRSVGMLAVGLVLVTAGTVAAAARAIIPGLGWAPAFVLGAIVAPPDAAVAISVARRLGIPKRLVTLLEGESLMNDTAAFVVYRMAVAATVTGVFSIRVALLRFAWMAVGGVLAGVVSGVVVVWLRKHLDHSAVENTISLLTPFAAFLPAEAMGASGVLAVVTCGLLLGRVGPRIVPARTRLQAQQVWSLLMFLLNGLIFLLIGLKLGDLGRGFARHLDGQLLKEMGIISAVVVLTRIAWMFPGAYGPRIFSRRIRERESLPDWRAVVFAAWTGLRGGDTLVTALAVPLITATGAPFPARDPIIALSFGVIVVTLLFQGLTLRPLARLLRLESTDATEEREEAEARRQIAEAGLATLRIEAQRAQLPDDWIAKMVGYHELRTQRDATRSKSTTGESPMGIAFEQIQRPVLDTERAAAIRLRDQGAINDPTLRKIQSEIDHEELRISEPDADV